MAIHLGLVDAVLDVLRIKSIPIVTCPKCLTWWSVMVLCLFTGQRVIDSVAVSFLLAYLAIWYDLLLGYLDKIYEKIYENLYQKENGGETGDSTDVHDQTEHNT